MSDIHEADTVKDVIGQLSTLGCILKLLDGDEVDDVSLAAAAESMVPGQRIGARLLEMRVITADQLERALVVQARIRVARGIDEVMDILNEVRAGAARARADLFEAIPNTDPGITR